MKKKMDKATRHRRLAWIGGGALVLYFGATAICAPESFQGDISMGSALRNLMSVALVIFAISVMKKKHKDKDPLD